MSWVSGSLVLGKWPNSTSPVIPNCWSKSTPRPISTVAAATPTSSDNNRTAVTSVGVSVIVVCVIVVRGVFWSCLARLTASRPDRVHPRVALGGGLIKRIDIARTFGRPSATLRGRLSVRQCISCSTVLRQHWWVGGW